MGKTTKKFTQHETEEKYVSFWRAGDQYRLQTNDQDVVRRVKKWKFARETGSGWNVNVYLFVIPVEKSSWVAQQFGIKKQPRTAKQGQVSRQLIEKGHGHRFNVPDSGQEFYSEPREGII